MRRINPDETPVTTTGRAWHLAMPFVVVAALASGCGPRPAAIDLIDVLPSAERRALGPADASIHTVTISHDGVDAPALLTTAPARVLFPVRMPGRAHLRAQVSLAAPAAGGVTIRVGIADDRSYDELLRLPVMPAPNGDSAPWQSIDVDLSGYSGWQWSLFYHPAHKTWKLVFNADPSPGGSIVWLRPTIEMR